MLETNIHISALTLLLLHRHFDFNHEIRAYRTFDNYFTGHMSVEEYVTEKCREQLWALTITARFYGEGFYLNLVPHPWGPKRKYYLDRRWYKLDKLEPLDSSDYRWIDANYYSVVQKILVTTHPMPVEKFEVALTTMVLEALKSLS